MKMKFFAALTLVVATVTAAFAIYAWNGPKAWASGVFFTLTGETSLRTGVLVESEEAIQLAPNTPMALRRFDTSSTTCKEFSTADTPL